MSLKPEFPQPSIEAAVFKNDHLPRSPETTETTPDIGKFCQELLNQERELANTAHDLAAKNISGLFEAKKLIPRSLKLGLYSLMLLKSETALAQMLVETKADETQLDAPRSGAQMSQATQEIVANLIAQGAAIEISRSPTWTLETVTWDDTQKNITVDETIGMIKIARTVPDTTVVPDELSVTGAPEGWKISQERIYANDGTWQDREKAVIYLKDDYGNLMTVTRTMSETGLTYEEKITIDPNNRLEAEPGQLQPINIDLSVVGLGRLEQAFAYKTFSFVDVAEEVPIYNISGFSVPDAEAKKLLKPYTGAIKSGLKESTTLFGLEPSFVDSIDIMDGARRNASAGVGVGTYHITFYDELFKATDDEDEIGGPEASSKKQIADTTKHEVYHLIDSHLNLRNTPEIQAVFLSTPHDVLNTLSEEHFNLEPTIYGGHAGDSATELVASFLNSLDDPKWEKQIQNLDHQALITYTNMLLATEAAVLRNPLVAREAPISNLLSQRTAFLTTVELPRRQAAE